MKTLLLILILLLTISITVQADKKENRYNITIRMGQGGFRDSRSDIGELGGDQVTFDIRYKEFPLAISYSGEYYTNSPDPSHSYEISSLDLINIIYIRQNRIFQRLTCFAGGGLGIAHVPKDNKSGTYENIAYDIEAGLQFRIYKALSVYGVYKYLYTYKEKDDIKVLDFNENIILIGLSFNFYIF